MNIKLTTYQNVFLLAAILAFSILLSACNLDMTALGGGGGLSNLEPTATDDPALPEEPTAEPEEPTPTPIPETYGHIIYVSNRDGQMDLYMTTPDGIEQTRLTIEASDDIAPRVSPDGSRVAFVSTVDGNMDIYVLDIATRVVTRITDAPEKDSSPAWSADGNMLAFESFRDGNFEIYISSVDGSNQIRLTDDPAGDVTPIWSPVSNEIVFVSNRFGNSDVLMLNLNGGVSTLTTNPAPDFAPAWSPDGNMLAYKISAGGDLTQICLIGRDGLGQRCITEFASEYSQPVWSPDGRFLAANAKQINGYGVTVFNIFDGSVVELNSPEVDPRGAPFWSPEGARLVLQALVEGNNMELYTVLVPTNEFIRLTTIPGYDGEPIWANQ